MTKKTRRWAKVETIVQQQIIKEIKPNILAVFDAHFPRRMNLKPQELPGVRDFFYVQGSNLGRYKDPSLLRNIWDMFQGEGGYIFFITKDKLFVESSQVDEVPHYGRIQIIGLLDKIWKQYFIGTYFYDLGHAPLPKLRGAVIHLWPHLLKHYPLA
ncbi:MAG: hypothetical protein PHT40_04320 [Patescibacteria group bacterium]|nr:hypothetical protein [Patescibacteria group bacterium]